MFVAALNKSIVVRLQLTCSAIINHLNITIMKKVINKTVIRDHKGDYKDYFQSVYFENIDETTIKNVTAVFICNDVKIIWRLY